MKLKRDQCGAWVLVQKSVNDAAFVMWDLRAQSRAHLDEWAKEYAETQVISGTRTARTLKVNPSGGQLVLFNSGYLHAIEKCASTRHTIGAFLIEHDGGWKLFD